MAAPRELIKVWLEEGIKNNATHVIIVCDTYDWEDYPVYVSKQENVRSVATIYNHRDMQKVMEVYDLQIDIEKQLNTYRVFNY